MTALIVAIVTGFRCEASKCSSVFTLAAPETTSPPESGRWHAPAGQDYYDAGWVTKIGHSHALHYCPTHAARAHRCTCDTFAGVTYIVDSCARHSDIADVRTSPEAVPPARISAWPEAKRITKYEHGQLLHEREYHDFTHGGLTWRWTATRVPFTGEVIVEWVSSPYRGGVQLH